MKKIITLFFCLMLILGLAACNHSDNANFVTQPPESSTSVPNESFTIELSETTDLTESTTDTDTQTGKVLVVYYSGSGHTARVAEDIAEASDADLFEITPVEPYSSGDLDYTNESSRVVQEYNDESLRDVALTTTTVENWDDYDTVFIGYPIWWQIAAWPVNNFVKNNDFTGKTVIPFATSASSGMGESGTLLEEMAGTGDWQEGQRFPSSAAKEDVQTWVNGLGL